jgi:hypothetical protein
VATEAPPCHPFRLLLFVHRFLRSVLIDAAHILANGFATRLESGCNLGVSRPTVRAIRQSNFLLDTIAWRWRALGDGSEAGIGQIQGCRAQRNFLRGYDDDVI